MRTLSHFAFLVKNCKSFDIIKVFFIQFCISYPCIGAHRTVDRLYTHTFTLLQLVICSFCSANQPNATKWRAFTSNEVDCVNLNHFYGVCLCFRNTWWMKYFITWSLLPVFFCVSSVVSWHKFKYCCILILFSSVGFLSFAMTCIAPQGCKTAIKRQCPYNNSFTYILTHTNSPLRSRANKKYV